MFLQDFAFILKGLTRLLNNPLMQTYLPGSCKRIQFHQELLVFFWKICDINKARDYSFVPTEDVDDVPIVENDDDDEDNNDDDDDVPTVDP